MNKRRPTDDYISRQAAIDALGMAIDVDDFRTATGLIHEATVSKVLDCIPAADVVPVAKIYDAGYKGKEVQFRIGGRLFAIRELAQ